MGLQILQKMQDFIKWMKILLESGSSYKQSIRQVDMTGASNENDLRIKGLTEALSKIDETLQYF